LEFFGKKFSDVEKNLRQEERDLEFRYLDVFDTAPSTADGAAGPG